MHTGRHAAAIAAGIPLATAAPTLRPATAA